MSTTPSAELIRKAFETRIAIWAAAQTPPIPLAFENSPFLPPVPSAINNAGRYGRVYVLAGQTNSFSLEGSHREYVGVFQVTLILGLNRGTKEASDLSNSLDLAFPAGPPLAQDSLNVWIVSPMSAVGAVPDPDHYVVPVSARYKAELFLAP